MGARVSVPERTAEQRSAALDRALAARRDRAQLRADLKAGTVDGRALIADAAHDDRWRQVRVRWLLESLPGIGPARAERLLDVCSIAPTRRLGGVSERQRQALLAELDRAAR